MTSQVERDPLHIFAHDLVEGRYEVVADTAQELVSSKSSGIEPRIRDSTP